MFYSPEEGRFLSRDLIRRPGVNPYTYANNTPTIFVDPLGLYEQAGHFWTTYEVARSLGATDDQAYKLAYYSQLPDQNKDYEATPNAIKYGIGSVASLGDAASREYWKKDNYFLDVNEILHSLSGFKGDELLKWRECLREIIKDKSGEFEIWEKGFVIHALGDAYAHTDPNGQLYGGSNTNIVGHGLASGGGHDPDRIGLRPELYKDYVTDLRGTLQGAFQGTTAPGAFTGAAEPGRIQDLLDAATELAGKKQHYFGGGIWEPGHPKNIKGMDQNKYFEETFGKASRGYTREKEYMPRTYNTDPKMEKPNELNVDKVKALIKKIKKKCNISCPK